MGEGGNNGKNVKMVRKGWLESEVVTPNHPNRNKVYVINSVSTYSECVFQEFSSWEGYLTNNRS